MTIAPKPDSAKVASSTSEKQPYMSEYDKNVEPRLQALENKSHDPCSSGSKVDLDKLTALEAKVDDLIERLNRKMSF